MQLRYGLLAELVAAPGEGDALAAFLASARETAAREEGTVTWSAFKLSDTTYGIFDTFASEDDRNAYLLCRTSQPCHASARSASLREPRPGMGRSWTLGDRSPPAHPRRGGASAGITVDSTIFPWTWPPASSV